MVKYEDTVYICYFNSWYHSLGFLSFLKEKEISAARIVIVSGGFINKKLSMDSMCFEEHAKEVLKLDSLEDIDKWLLDASWQQLKVCMVSASRTPYRLLKVLRNHNLRPEMLVVEEGLSTYGDYLSGVKGLYRVNMVKRNLFSLFKFFLVLVVAEIKKVVFFNIKKRHWFNFDRKALTENSDVISGYKKALSAVCLEEPYIFSDNAVLFISSPFCELGMVGEDEYIEFLDKYFAGKKLYVKPHPAEDRIKYQSIGAVVLDPQVPVERFAHHLPAGCEVYAFSSTSVYTLRLFFGIEVHRIPDLDFLYHNLSSCQQDLMSV